MCPPTGKAVAVPTAVFLLESLELVQRTLEMRPYSALSEYYETPTDGSGRLVLEPCSGRGTEKPGVQRAHSEHPWAPVYSGRAPPPG